MTEKQSEPEYQGKRLSDLLGALYAEDFDARLDAASALQSWAQLKPDQLLEAVPVLAASLKDPAVEIRSLLLEALKWLGPRARSALPRIREALQDEDKDIRFDAGQALVAVGAVEEGLPYIIQILENPCHDFNRTYEVLNNFCTLGPAVNPALPALLKCLEVPFPDVYVPASEAVKTLLGPAEIVAVVSKLLCNKHDVIRKNSAEMLAGFGQAAALAIPALIECLKSDEDPTVRTTFAMALGKIGPGNESVVQALIEALSDENEEVRIMAGAALVAVPTYAAQTVSLIRQGIRSASTEMRRHVAYAASCFIGPEQKELIPDLITLLIEKEKDSELKTAADYAAKALARIGLDALNPVIDALSHPDLYVHWGACHALEEMGTAARPAIPHLCHIIQNEKMYEEKEDEGTLSVPVVGGAMFALAKVVGPENDSIVPILVKALGWTKHLQISAIHGLTRIGSPTAITAIKRSLADENEDVRKAAEEALKKLVARGQEEGNIDQGKDG